MFDWFKKVFKSAPAVFTIEHYPITGRYYPTYNNYYLKTQSSTGIVKPIESFLFAYADKFNTEEGARRLIDLFKEQQLKENIKITTVE